MSSDRQEAAIPVQTLFDARNPGPQTVSELGFDPTLPLIVATACQLLEARYGALGILHPSRTKLELLITAGIDEHARKQIPHLPHGRGVLGQLVMDPQPLRVTNLSRDPQTYGFADGHPPMTTFLGVPVLFEEQPIGNLYVTDKADGEQFTERDENLLIAFAGIAGSIIDHARPQAR